MLTARRPGDRLITQNLLLSATGFEREKEVSLSSLQDLSVLIDLFCLYERAVVISRNSWIPFGELKSDLMALLGEHSFVEIDEPGSKDTAAIAIAAQKHLATFLGVNEVEKYDRLLRYVLSPSQASYGIHYHADGVEDLQLGRQWLYSASKRESLLRQLGSEEHVARGTTFLVRTFLYLAYADVAKLTFTPDAVRCPVLDNILEKEDEFLRQKLMSELRSRWEHFPTYGYRELRRTVSPFAAIVFERAKNRNEIVSEMEILRKQIAPLRARVYDLEEKALWGTHDEAVDAEGEWHRVLAEIEKNFGPDPHLVSIKRAIAFGESMGETIDMPTSWKNWLSLLTSLPLKIAVRLVYQRPAIEIHRLRSELPSPGRLARSVERLFGKVQ